MTICKKCKFEEKGMLSGQGFTEFICDLCGKKDIWHNTNTPRFCHECSEQLDMCQRCGGPLEKKEEEKDS